MYSIRLSAMGQGQAISLLSRAFYHSGGNIQYLNTAWAALKPFKVYSENGGVLSEFMNKHPWFDEYPTIPPIFILNGFMYSLIGLYDLYSLTPNSSQVYYNILIIKKKPIKLVLLNLIKMVF